MSGETRRNLIRNEYVRGCIGVAMIVDKTRENRLRWFAHFMRRENSKAVGTVMKINVQEIKEEYDLKRSGWMQLGVI